MPERPAQVMVPVLVTVNTAAQLLGRSPKTVRRRIAAGLIPAVIEGEHPMIRADELKRYIDGLERPVANQPPRRHRRHRRPADDQDYGFLRQ